MGIPERLQHSVEEGVQRLREVEMLDGFTMEDLGMFHLTVLRQNPGNSPFMKVTGNKPVREQRHF